MAISKSQLLEENLVSTDPKANLLQMVQVVYDMGYKDAGLGQVYNSDSDGAAYFRRDDYTAVIISKGNKHEKIKHYLYEIKD
ncbi:hypothetical protein CL622_08075 [archaeon]|nr:hypothetical protein [archaeon]